MAVARSVAPTPNIAPFVATGAVLLAIGAAFLRLPAALVLLIGLSIAGWMSSPPPLTGKKDQYGYPTVGNPGEGKKLSQHQVWSELRWKLFVPNADWLFNRPDTFRRWKSRTDTITRLFPALEKAGQLTVIILGAGWLLLPAAFVTTAAIAIAIAVATLPTDGLAIWGIAPGSMTPLMWANAIAAYILVQQIFAIRRRHAAPADEQPALDLPRLITAVRDRGQSLFVPTIAAAAAGLVSAAAVSVALLGTRIDWLIAPWQVTATGTGIAAACLVLRKFALPEGLTDWHNLVDARAAWTPRWEAMKVTPEPRLISHRRYPITDGVPPVTVETFEAPATIGAHGILGLGGKNKDPLAAAIGGGGTAVTLNEPDLGSDGRPVPQTRSPLGFTIVNWPTGAQLDVSTRKVDLDAFDALLRATAALSIDPAAEKQLMLSGITLASKPSDAMPGVLWATEWNAPEGASLWSLAAVAAGVHGRFGVNAIPDPEGGVLYIGSFDEETTEFADPGLPARLVELDRQNQWEGRWQAALPLNTQRPVIQHPTYQELETADGGVIYTQAFLFNQGMVMNDWINQKVESSLANTTFDGSKMVSTQHFPDQRLQDPAGSRHNGAIAVFWSFDDIPTNASDLRSAPSRDVSGAERSYLQHQINQANRAILQRQVDAGFDAAKLPRPEIVSIQILTARSSRKHIWDIKLRFYDGVSLAEVKKKMAVIQDGMGAPAWFRVTGLDRGCRIVVGAHPQDTDVKFLRQPYRDLCTALDWEQAFTDAKVLGPNGEAPKRLSISPMPRNPKVEELVFRLPAGVDRGAVHAVRSKLKAMTGNLYLEDEQGPTPDTVKMIACATEPVPFPAPFDWGAVAESKAVPFASGVTGDPIEYDWTLDPHLLILGGSGSGKAELLDAPIPVPISDRFPTGWAQNQDLRPGDAVYGPNGAPVIVQGFSDERTEKTYTVTFDDGQQVTVSGHHSWRVWDRAARKKMIPTRDAARTGERSRRLAEAARLDILAASIAPGAGASAVDIARLAGRNAEDLYRAGVLSEALSRKGLVKTKKTARVYDATELLGHMRAAVEHGGGQTTFAGVPVTAETLDDLGLEGAWLSTRDFADALVGAPSTRDQRDLAKQIVRRKGVSSRDGFARQMVTLYPADEVIRLLARYERRIGEERHAEPSETVIHTEDMARSVTTVSGHANYAIDIPPAFTAPEADLPVPPYTLGAWLGDGSSHSAGITSMDDAIIDAVVADGYAVRRTYRHVAGGAAQEYHFEGLPAQIHQLYGSTQASGADKRIPAVYQRASIAQRTALLQGLMDTDGTIDTAGNCELTLCKEDLLMDALELIRGLGIKASVTSGDAAITDPDGSRRVVGTRFRVNFTTALPVFRLPRKAERIPAETRVTTRRLYVTSITEGDPAPMRCLRVTGADHLYLTHGFVPTHNSALLQNLITVSLIRGCELYVADPTKAAADFQYATPWVKAMPVTELEASAMMDHVYDEVKRRRDLNAAHGAASYRDLPADVRPPHMIVIIDEFTSLMFTDKLDKLPQNATEEEVFAHQEMELSNSARRNIGAKSGRLVREARSAGVTLILAAQELKSDTIAKIPGGTSLKGNSSSILLGKSTFGSRQSALKDPLAAPELGDGAPRGRGLFESSASSAQVIQSWYDAPDHLGSMTEQIAAVRAPLDPSEKIDLSSRIKQVEEGPVFGRVIDDDQPGGGVSPLELADDASDEIIDMGEVDIDFGDLFSEPAAPAVEPEPEPEAEAPVELDIDIEIDDLDEPAPTPDVPLLIELDDTAPAQKKPAPAPRPFVARFVGPGLSEDDFPGAVELVRLPPGEEVTGDSIVDTLLGWVTTHPGVAAIEWASPAAPGRMQKLEEAAELLGIDRVRYVHIERTATSKIDPEPVSESEVEVDPLPTLDFTSEFETASERPEDIPHAPAVRPHLEPPGPERRTPAVPRVAEVPAPVYDDEFGVPMNPVEDGF